MKDIVIPTLRPEDIEVKVKKIGEKSIQVLLYKTARTDMEYLDKVFGVGNWQCDYKEIKGNLYCTIQIWDDEKQQWISKIDCGIESREDGEGNEKKGEASDAFKRAGFKVGIGRELYSSPQIFIWSSVCPTESNGKGGWKLKDPYVKFSVSDIEYDSNRKITKLVIINEKTGEVVYQNGGSTQPKAKTGTKEQKAPSKKQEAPKQDASKQEAPKVTVETASAIPSQNEEPYKLVIKAFNEKHKLDRKRFVELYNSAVQSGKITPTAPLNNLVPDEWIKLIATMENLFMDGFFKDVA